MLGVSSSGYYGWVDRPLSQRAQEEIRLGVEIKEFHHYIHLQLVFFRVVWAKDHPATSVKLGTVNVFIP
jgi:hypothetical protein